MSEPLAEGPSSILYPTLGVVDSSVISVQPVSVREITRNLMEMTRLRLNMLVLLTTAIGFLLGASAGNLLGVEAWWRLFHVLLGTAICGCAGSVLNQWIERGTDPLMRRTADRPIPTGRIDPTVALWFGTLLSIVGVVHLALLVNWLAALLALTTIILYSFVYTPMKYRHWTCTIMGAIPGAIPPIIGWAGAAGALSIEALALFMILFAWQMPHFYAIGSKYREEYAAAGIQILPVVDNEQLDRTMRSVITWSIFLAACTIWPLAIGMIGWIGLVCMLVMNGVQMVLALQLYRERSKVSARKFFLWTVMYLPVVLVVLLLGGVEVSSG